MVIDGFDLQPICHPFEVHLHMIHDIRQPRQGAIGGLFNGLAVPLAIMATAADTIDICSHLLERIQLQLSGMLMFAFALITAHANEWGGLA